MLIDFSLFLKFKQLLIHSKANKNSSCSQRIKNHQQSRKSEVPTQHAHFCISRLHFGTKSKGHKHRKFPEHDFSLHSCVPHIIKSSQPGLGRPQEKAIGVTSLCVPVCLPLPPSKYVSPCPSVLPSISLDTCLFARIYLYLSVCLSFCISLLIVN